MNGTSYEQFNAFRKLAGKLAREQRKLARQVKKPNNRQKQKGKITRLHIRVADACNANLYKVFTEDSKNQAVVLLGELKVQNMSKSAKGNGKEPGRNVRQKADLNKAILDHGRDGFRRQHEYEQAWLSGRVLFANPAYTIE